MATADITKAPPGHETGLQSAGADILDFPPHSTDGDFLNPEYTLVPAEEQGSFFAPNRLARFPLGLAVGLGQAAYAVARHYSGTGGGPEVKVFDIDGVERIARVTEPDEATGVDPKTAETDVLIFGLSEMDIGSGIAFHNAKARQHPERRIASITTPGVDLNGKILSVSEALNRPLSLTAAENIKIVRKIAGENRANMGGVSMGTYITYLMAMQNLAAGEAALLNTERLELTSPAIGARNVPEDKKTQELDAADKELIDEATSEFFAHMRDDIGEMIKSHPRKTAECFSVVLAYLMELHKIPNRSAAIVGNLRGVQQGIEWEDVLAVAQAYKVHVLAGQEDSLWQQQRSQWITVKGEAPSTKIRVLVGLGHAMTADAPGSVSHLDQMNQESAGLALAAA